MTEPSAKVLRASHRARRQARLEPSAEAPQASRRARRRARLESNPPPKHRERADAQVAGPVSNPILRRTAVSEQLGKTPHLPRTIRRSDTQASHLASRRVGLKPHAPPREPPRTPSRPLSNPSRKPWPRSRVRSGTQAAAGGHHRYRTEPLRLFTLNPLTVGELGRIVMGGVIPV